MAREAALIKQLQAGEPWAHQRTGVAFVLFTDEEPPKTVVKLNTGWLAYQFCHRGGIHGRPTRAIRSPPQHEILWENLKDSYLNRYARRVLSFIILVGIIAAMWVFNWVMILWKATPPPIRVTEPARPMIFRCVYGLLLGILHKLVYHAIKYLVDFEHHHSKAGRDHALVMKLCIAYIVDSFGFPLLYPFYYMGSDVVPMLRMSEYSSMWAWPYLSDGLSSDLLFSGLLDPGLQILLDWFHPIRLYKQLVLARRVKTRLELSRIFTLDTFEYALPMALAVKLVWTGLVQGFFIPLNMALMFFGLFGLYCMSKYNLLRVSNTPPRTDSTDMHTTALYISILAILLRCLISVLIYAFWMNDHILTPIHVVLTLGTAALGIIAMLPLRCLWNRILKIRTLKGTQYRPFKEGKFKDQVRPPLYSVWTRSNPVPTLAGGSAPGSLYGMQPKQTTASPEPPKAPSAAVMSNPLYAARA
ncbi:hypothetical protein PAPYR_7185 [Paratrimastix pyriformis]|uniref:Uncharacterized protein n=1 Tax=Paratrimastix pyriformis TaxID=342808 RepID=A0ABQ8UF43_9EUKA|nr:hypothetical protein PAPYR_7185 [Paratrimastix pyriformis]